MLRVLEFRTISIITHVSQRPELIDLKSYTTYPHLSQPFLYPIQQLHQLCYCHPSNTMPSFPSKAQRVLDYRPPPTRKQLSDAPVTAKTKREKVAAPPKVAGPTKGVKVTALRSGTKITSELKDTPKTMVTPRTIATSKTTATPKPTVTSMPLVTPRPTRTHTPTVTSKPTVTSNPAVTPRPTVAHKPTVTSKPKATPKSIDESSIRALSNIWSSGWQPPGDRPKHTPPSPPKKEEPKVLPPHHHVDTHVMFFHAVERLYEAKKHGQELRAADEKIVYGQPGGESSAVYWERAEKEMKANHASKEVIQGLAAMRAKEDRMLKYLWPEDPEGMFTEGWYAKLRAEDEAREQARLARNKAEEEEARRQGWRPKHER